MSSETTQGVSAFFESYRTEFERFDAPAIARHFAYPSHVTSDTGQISLSSIASMEEWIGKLERLLDMYRAIGVASARVLDLSETALSPRLIQAIVHWELRDGAGQLLYDFEAAYTLAEIDGDLRIAAIAHDEIPRYRACLARLGSRRAVGDAAIERPERA